MKQEITKLPDVKKIHFTGIGGIGMSALAGLLNAKGYKITGSDQVEEFPVQNLKKNGVTHINVPKNKGKIPPKTELLIYSEAVPKTNSERKDATKKGILQINYFEALGLLSKEYENVIAIAGTNGKTTTTSMTAKIFEEAGYKPTVIVGSFILPEKQNFIHGDNEYLIVEACEYRRNFLPLYPTCITVTNIAPDHLDYFKDLNDITSAFQEFADKLPQNGVLISNNNDSTVKKISAESEQITYGIKKSSDYVATQIKYRSSKTTFQIQTKKQEKIVNIKIHVPGEFNIENALAASATAMHYGIKPKKVKKALKKFQGSWRRFEQIGTYKNATLISDYAHHPDAISKTIKGAKDFYPKKRIITVFQPHQRNRTENLFDDFVNSFKKSDIVILSEIYYVKGREKAEGRTAKDLGIKIKEKFKKDVYYAPTLKEIPRVLKEIAEKNDVIIFMGAGDIYMTAEKISNKSL